MYLVLDIDTYLCKYLAHTIFHRKNAFSSSFPTMSLCGDKAGLCNQQKADHDLQEKIQPGL